MWSMKFNLAPMVIRNPDEKHLHALRTNQSCDSSWSKGRRRGGSGAVWQLMRYINEIAQGAGFNNQPMVPFEGRRA